MAQQTINIGAIANDGTGDPIRDAFNKANANFTELYGRVAALEAVAQKYRSTIAVSDETSDITTGAAKITFYMEAAVTLSEVFIGLSDPSSSGIVRVNVKKAGVTIFSTRPSIDATEDTSLTGTAAVLSTTSFAKGDKITIDIDDAGTDAKGLKVTLIGVYQ
ncbi:hypothetical protein [Mesorhizobium sp. M0129]|uniref:hypothetical protein n=1 Tax=Mesorhizobium sp. M0129 TaxID=2956886 RepID=UPI00333AB25B